MPYLERRGKPRLHYELHDFTDPWRNAPIVLLQHGFGRSSRLWFSWIPYLSRFYKVVCPDLRGLGKSQADFDLDRELTVQACMEDLLAIFDAVGAERVHYCGESLGGILGMVLAAEYPARVRTLSLVAAPVYLSEQTQKTFALGHASWQEALQKLGVRGWVEGTNPIVRFPPDTDPGMLRWYAEEVSKSKVEVMVALSRLASKVNVTPYLPRIQAPVLGLYPSSGPITSGEHENLLLTQIPNVRIVHLPSRYHKIQNLAAASCATQVLHFASQYDGVACHE